MVDINSFSNLSFNTDHDTDDSVENYKYILEIISYKLNDLQNYHSTLKSLYDFYNKYKTFSENSLPYNILKTIDTLQKLKDFSYDTSNILYDFNIIFKNINNKNYDKNIIKNYFCVPNSTVLSVYDINYNYDNADNNIILSILNNEKILKIPYNLYKIYILLYSIYIYEKMKDLKLIHINSLLSNINEKITFSMEKIKDNKINYYSIYNNIIKSIIYSFILGVFIKNKLNDEEYSKLIKIIMSDPYVSVLDNSSPMSYIHICYSSVPYILFADTKIHNNNYIGIYDTKNNVINTLLFSKYLNNLFKESNSIHKFISNTDIDVSNYLSIFNNDNYNNTIYINGLNNYIPDIGIDYNTLNSLLNNKLINTTQQNNLEPVKNKLNINKNYRCEKIDGITIYQKRFNNKWVPCNKEEYELYASSSSENV